MDNIDKTALKVFLIFIFMILLGVSGYIVIEGWSFIDALFMTVITISTVGYREVRPLSLHGEVFTIFFILVGVGSFFYIITTLAEYILSGHLKGNLEKKRMKNQIAKLRNHYIICGFGRVGQEVAKELKREGVNFVVIDNQPAAIQRCEQIGYLYIEGTASDDQSLIDAGAMNAAGLVPATDSDAENVYITLSVKNMRKDLYVVARASTQEAGQKLLKASADRVISPYSIGGKRIAGTLLRPNVVEFIDFVLHNGELDFFLEEIEVKERSHFQGMTIGEARARNRTSANILAIKKKKENRLIAGPEPQVPIEEGDLLIILGTKGQLKEMERLIASA